MIQLLNLIFLAKGLPLKSILSFSFAERFAAHDGCSSSVDSLFDFELSENQNQLIKELKTNYSKPLGNGFDSNFFGFKLDFR